GLLQLARLVGVVKNERVQVAVAGVEYIGDAQSVFLGKLAHAGQNARQFLARNGTVHAIVVGRDAADGRESRLAARPEAQALLIRSGGAIGGAAVLRGYGAHALDQVIHLSHRAVQLHDEQGLDVEGIARVDEILRRVDGGAVHHFHAAGDDAGGYDVGHALAGLFAGREADQQGAGGLGLAQDADGDLGDHAEQTFRTGHESEEVVALWVQVLAAQPDDLAVHQHHLDAENIVGGKAVFQAVNAAGVLRDVAADGAGDLRGRVRRVIEAFMLHRLGDAQVGDTRLRDHNTVGIVDLEDAVELAHHEQDRILERQGAAGKRRA